jgi:ABC-type transport system substrate-binding protein
MGKNPVAHTFKWLWSSPMDVILLFAGSVGIPAPNWQNARIKALDDQFTAWQHANSPAQLKAAAQAAQLVAAEQLPYLPIYTPNAVWVHNKKVHGWRPTATTLYPFYNDVWME